MDIQHACRNKKCIWNFGFSWRWRFRCCSPAFIRRASTNVSEQSTVSIFGTFLRNVGWYIQYYTAYKRKRSTSKRSEWKILTDVPQRKVSRGRFRLDLEDNIKIDFERNAVYVW